MTQKAPRNWNELIALAVGAGAGFLLGVVMTASPLKQFLVDSTGRLQWETLLAGLLALFGAGLTVKKIAEQIELSERQAKDARERKRRAALASLPVALTEIGRYAARCIKGLQALRSEFDTNTGILRRRRFPISPDLNDLALPESVLETLKECIELADGPGVTALEAIIRFFQIQNFRLIEDIARMRSGIPSQAVLWANVESDIMDAAELWSRSAVLFPFARGEEAGPVEPTRHQVYNAFLFAGCFNDGHKMDELADRWLEQYRIRKARGRTDDQRR